MARIFLTGASGYIGGDVLHRLASLNRPSLSISSLVRGQGNVQKIAQAYPNARIVEGDLNDAALIEREAGQADIILNLASTNHIDSARAIQRGLEVKKQQNPPYWIQMAGGSLVAGKEVAEGRFGFATDKSYDDLEDAEETLQLIKDNSKRAVENLVVSQSPSVIKTALVVGPLIYGIGRGPVNTRSIQVPEMARAMMQMQQGFRLGKGENAWSNVHVHDLSNMIVSLVEAAVESKSNLWNQEGLYFLENGKKTFGELSALVAVEAHSQGHLPKAEVDKVISGSEADALSPHASILWGTNAILRSSRARKNLDWQPSSPSLEEEIPKIVRSEANRLAPIHNKL